MWNRGVKEDGILFTRLYKALWLKERSFLPYLDLKLTLSECETDNRGALCFRKRLWKPDWEPLKTALIHKVHDSHISGHPGRDTTLSILSRSFYWPRMSTMVRRFCRNCDVCGRSHVWRSRRQGLLLLLPVPDRFQSELFIDLMTELPAKLKDQPRYLIHRSITEISYPGSYDLHGCRGLC